MLRYGFYDSEDGDRTYDAQDMSRLFNGIIMDGVFGTVGEHFAVHANGYLTVRVGDGRAWFNDTWTDLRANNTEDRLVFNIASNTDGQDRTDWIVLEVNKSTRTNAIKLYQNTYPDDTASRFYYPLAKIRVEPGVTALSQASITPMVGTSYTPFVSGPLETISIDDLIEQWEAEIDDRIDAAIDAYFDDGSGIQFAKVPTDIGNGFGTCISSGSTTLSVSIPGYKLTPNGRVSIYFSYDVPANSTLNITATGAKPIYYGYSSQLPDGIIRGGTIATFVYVNDAGGKYYLTALNKAGSDNVQFVKLTRSGSSLSSDTNADLVRVMLANNPNLLIILIDPDKRQGTLVEAPVNIGDSMAFSVPTDSGTLYYTITSAGVVSVETISSGGADLPELVNGDLNKVIIAINDPVSDELVWSKGIIPPGANGFGFGTCSTVAETIQKTAFINNFRLVSEGVVNIQFTYAVPANATLNINSTGAKALRWHGSAIREGIIHAGDIATIMYDGTYYNVLNVDQISFERLSISIRNSLNAADTALQPSSNAEFVTMSISGTTITVNQSLDSLIELCAKQKKVYFTAVIDNSGVNFIPVSVDLDQASYLTLQATSNGIIYSITLTSGSGSTSTGTLTQITVNDSSVVTASAVAQAIGNMTVAQIGGVVSDLDVVSNPTKETVSGTTVNLAPEDNTIYVCGEITSLTLSENLYITSYIVEFTSGATATVLTVPSGYKAPGGDLTPEANKTYELNVRNGKAVLTAFEAVSSGA